MATALALSLVGSACGQETDLQIIQGTIPQSSLPFTTTMVLAFEDSTILSASRLSSNSRFTLAVPISNDITLAASTIQGPVAIFSDGPLRVCNPGLPIDLGLLDSWTGDPACEASQACLEADMILNTCLDESEQICRRLFEGVLNCRDTQDAACMPLREVLDTCMMEQPSCETEVLALFDCESQFGCQTLENDYFEVCDEPCAQELGSQQMICHDMTDVPCAELPGGELIPSVPLPTSIGCMDGDF